MAVTPADLGLEAVRLAASVVYVIVATLILRRPVDPEARPAQYGFATWWLGVAALGVASVPSGLGWNVAESGVLAWRAWVYFVFGVVFLALAGLVYYLLYLYTGRRRLWRAVLLFYVLLAAYMVYLVEGFGPYVGVQEGTTTVLFEREHPPLAALAFSLGLSLPPLAAALAYFLLLFRLDDRESRYRIMLVSGGLGLWFLYSVLATLFRFITDTDPTYLSTVVGQLFGLLAAVLVLLAFAPPRPVRRWIDGQEATA